MDITKPGIMKIIKGQWSIKDVPKVFFLYTLRYFIPYMPFNLQHGLSKFLCWFTAWGEKYRVIEGQLRELFGTGAFSTKDVNNIVCQSVSNFRKDMFETWSFSRLNRHNIGKICRIEGINYIDDALSKGKGALIMLCHFGSYKMLLPALGYRGYSITQVAVNPLDFVKPKESVIRNITMAIEYECEAVLPADFIYLGQTSPRQMYRVLEANGLLAMSVDGVVDPKRVAVSLLSKKIRLSSAPVKIALKIGSPILPLFTVRGPDNIHTLVVEPPISISGEGGTETEFKVLQEYAKLMERHIKANPSHYGWFLYKNETSLPEIGKIIIS